MALFGSGGGGVTGDEIASDALQYRGEGYIYGGTGAHPGDWDCSSYFSYVLGHDLGLELPGGSWAQVTANGTVHGPVVESYASWRGAVTVKNPQRGDMVCFVGEGTSGHIGIVLAVNQMVSALDSASGTTVTPIIGYGPPGAPIVYRRVIAAAAGSVLGAAGPVGSAVGGTAGIQGDLAAAGMALLVVGVMAGAVLALAALAGTGLALGGLWLAKEASGA